MRSAHFFGVAAQVMRHLLIDHARSRRYARRGGSTVRITLDDNVAASPGESIDLLALDEVLDRLDGIDERKRRIVELRYFRRVERRRDGGSAWRIGHHRQA